MIRGLLGIIGVAALQALPFVPGLMSPSFCLKLFGIPFYVAWLPLFSLLVCLVALRLQLRFGLVWLLLTFLTSSYQRAENYELLWSSALSRLTVYFREVIARYGDIVTGAACDIPFAPIQFWAAEAYGYGTTSIGLLACIAYRFWPRYAR